jgi:hypothetical protein
MKDAVFWGVTLYSGTDFLMVCRNMLPPPSWSKSTAAQWNNSTVQEEVLRTWLCEWASARYGHQKGVGPKQPRKKQGRTCVMRRKKKGKYYIQHTYSPQPLPWPCCLCQLSLLLTHPQRHVLSNSVNLTVADSSTVMMDTGDSCRTLVNRY